MHKIRVLIVIMVIGISLIAEDIDLGWNKPARTNQIKRSWLLGTTEVISAGEEKAGEYDLALSSPAKFTESLRRYFSIKDKSSFFYYQPGKESYLQLSLQAGSDLVYADSSFAFMHYGWQLGGRFSERLSFYSEFWTGHFEGARSFYDQSELIDSWTKRQEGVLYLDNLRGKLLYRGEIIDAGIGRGRYQRGSSITGSIILSQQCNDYGYINFDLLLGDFRFSTFNASLTADSSSVHESEHFADYRYNEHKFITIHDLSWQADERLKLFIGEIVIYGARYAELSYQMPLNFIRAIEHNLGDNDNVLIYAGWEWQLRDHLFYGNLILDELRKSEILGNWWGNKYAFQAGNVYCRNKLKLAGEFTAVRPWLYTHKSIFTRYSHDQSGLGFPEGSNLIQAAAAIDWEINERLQWNNLAAFIRQGEEGNSWELNYNNEITDIDNEETRWLAGKPKNRWKLQSVISWQPLAHHWVKLGIETQILENETRAELSFSWLTRY